jgi:putative modified peptide
MAGTPLTPELVDKLLDKLGSDDQFRADFQKDPDAAMRQLGAPANFKSGKCNPHQLASKEEIQRTRKEIRGALFGLSEMAQEALKAERST